MNEPVVLVLAALVGLIYYASRQVFYPMIDCRKCKGSAKKRAKRNRRTFRRCRRCGGEGSKKRLGRRIFDYWYLRTHDAK